ncbi:MAG: glycosyltransferase [Erysipelotrichaceae bacterium]|nr:glycosyltransferase [Erysipelotrichaceae bacterium]
MVKVSVIVPCFNAEKYISKALDSLLSQTLDDMEIIVINDGSSDNSKEIIDEYYKKYPNKIRVYHQENKGIASVRNYGLSLVNGEYFGFLDSDDYTKSDMYFKMYAKAKETDADMVVSNFMWVSDKKERLEKEGPYIAGKDMMVKLFATLWNKIYKTSLIKESDLKFPDGNRYEDACFLYCLSSILKKVEFIDEAFVSYVQVSTSITHTNNQQVKNMITVFNIIYDYYKNNNLFDEYKDELEYIHIKFFLGNSFLRSSLIKDKDDRYNTIMMGFNLLNDKFPNWYKNKYLNEFGGIKHKYFKIVRKWNIMVFSWLYRQLNKMML